MVIVDITQWNYCYSVEFFLSQARKLKTKRDFSDYLPITKRVFRRVCNILHSQCRRQQQINVFSGCIQQLVIKKRRKEFLNLKVHRFIEFNVSIDIEKWWS